jgi:tetratricopeptide (TPR) repeat protein
MDRRKWSVIQNLGVIYTILGKLDEAYTFCLKAIEANAQYAEAYNNLGVLYRDEGRITEAVHHYEQCLRLDPASKNAGQNRFVLLIPSLFSPIVFACTHRAAALFTAALFGLPVHCFVQVAGLELRDGCRRSPGFVSTSRVGPSLRKVV